MTPNLITKNIASLLKGIIGNKVLLITFFSLFTHAAFAATSFITIAEAESLTYTEPDPDDDVAFDGESDGVGTLVIESGIYATPFSIGADHPLLSVNIESGGTLHSNAFEDISATNITNSGTLVFNTAPVSRTINGNVSGTGTGTFEFGTRDHTVVGSFTTLAGDAISVNIENSSLAGSITSTGQANIEAGTKLHVTLEPTREGSTIESLIEGSIYTVVSGDSGSQMNVISEEDIDVDNSGTNRSGNLVFRTNVSENNITLQAIAKNHALSSLSGESEAYDAIHYYLDATGSMATIQSYLDSSSVSNADKSEAIKSTTTQADNSNNRMIFNANNASLNLTSDRLGSLRASGSGISSGDEGASKNIWIQQFGSSVTQGNVSGSEGYRSKSFGATLGADVEIFENFILGVSGSYSKANTKSKNALQESGIDSYQGNIYTGYSMNDKYFINTMLGMSWNEYTGLRAIPVAGAVAHSKYSGQSYVGRIETGFDQKFNNGFMITPKLIVTAAHNRTNDYTEDGAGTLNLNVKTKSSDFFETRFGTVFGYEIVTKLGKFIPNISLSYGYDFAASKQITNSNFIGQTAAFKSNGPRISQGSWNVGTGLDIYNMHSITISADYNYDYRKEYHGHIGVVKVKYNF